MKETALYVPENTKEMIDLIKFVEQAQQKTLIKLREDIKVGPLEFVLNFYL